MKVGVLYCVVGPRGTGKDQIIEGAKRRLSGDSRFVFPRRIITLSESTSAGVVHQAVTPAQFDALRRSGAFSLYWYDNGIGYAIPRSIYAALAAGRGVIAHVSREILPAAWKQYPRVAVIEVQAPTWLIAERLARMDMSLSAAERRHLAEEGENDADFIVRNDGLLSTAVDRFIQALFAGAAMPQRQVSNVGPRVQSVARQAADDRLSRLSGEP